MRFGDYWRVLLSHIILFGFVYPDKRQEIPAWVMEELARRLALDITRTADDTSATARCSRVSSTCTTSSDWIPRRPSSNPTGT